MRALALLCVLVACERADDPGFEVVRVPAAAYGPGKPLADASADGPHVRSDGGAAHPVICIPQPDEQPDEDDAAEGYPACPAHHEGRDFDKRATDRHSENVCCYGRQTPKPTE